MTASLFALNENTHRHLRIKRDRTFRHAASQHLVPIMVDEVLDAGIEFPIVFVKNAQTGSFTLCAILGLKAHSNEYCGRDKFDAVYVPRVLRLYPFALRDDGATGHAEVCLFEDPAVVNEQEGEALYSANGDASSFLQSHVTLLTNHHQQLQQTEAFSQMLLEQGLLHEQSIKINLNGEAISFDGVYVPDQRQLDKLESHKLAALRDNGSLAILYAMQNSLKQLNRLIMRCQANRV